MAVELIGWNQTAGAHWAKYRGLSADAKPTTDLVDGSEFYETDTKKVYTLLTGAWYCVAADIKELVARVQALEAKS